MWSDDTHDSQSPLDHYTTGEGSSSAASSPSTNSSTATQCDPLTDFDDDFVGVLHDRDQPLPTLEVTSTATNHPFLNGAGGGDDDEDDDITDGPHVDILALANVLSHGLAGLDDEEPESANSNVAGGGQSSSSEPPLAAGLHPSNPLTLPLSPHNGLPQGYNHHQNPPPFLHTNNNMQTHPNTVAHPPVPAAGPQEGDQPTNSNHVQLLHHPQVTHPNVFSNPNATALGPENYNLSDFVRVWAWQAGAWQGLPRERGRCPWPTRINQQLAHNMTHVDYSDLEGDRYDVQGLDWEDLGVTRSEARERRLNTYKNYVNIPNSDRWQVRRLPPERTTCRCPANTTSQETRDMLPCSDNFFRFRRLDVRKNINLAHFQLRSFLASTSRSQVFYPGQTAVQEYNPVTGKGKVGMKSRDIPQLQVSTLAADYDTLVAGGFFGEYCFRRLSEDGNSEVHEGTITGDSSGITNHVQLHLSRTSSSPRAAFASNDSGFRVLDIETDKFISETIFPQPVNCSAVSPDRRLRVMVGDQTQVLITKAEADGQPEILQTLDGHGDFGFACAWADDEWTIATGFQDKSVKIWDARRWTDASGKASPVATLGCEMAGVRALRFSPLGSGRRVLVAAEEADFVNIYDGQTFQSKQTFDFFGEIGGVSFTNEGQDLHILCCDRARGGLFQLEKCGVGAERNWDPEYVDRRPSARKWMDDGSYDWQEFTTTTRRIPRYSETRRRRRAAAQNALDPF